MSNATAPNALAPWQKLTLIAIVIVALVGLSYVIIRPAGGDCSTVFEQTAPGLQANLEIIQNKGAFAVSREKIQELSESAQRVGLHVKTCCMVLEGGQLNPTQFQQCMQGAVEYDRKVAMVAEQVVEAEAVAASGNAELLQAKSTQIDASIAQVASTADSVSSQTVTPEPLASDGTNKNSAVTNSELEPNNIILEATTIAPSAAVSGEILDGEDNDFYTFNYSGKARDLIAITLQNQSTTLRPWIKVYDADKSQISSKYDNTPGANVTQMIAAAPQTTYYVQVLPYDTKGKYTLLIEPSQTYDKFEPNEDAFSAVDIGSDKSVVANIMDGQDNDWYQLNAGAVDTISVRLENRSTTLRPWLKVYDRNKSEILSQYDGTLGSDLEVSFKVVAGETYFIQVRPNNSYGAYRLVVE